MMSSVAVPTSFRTHTALLKNIAKHYRADTCILHNRKVKDLQVSDQYGGKVKKG
jgi:hypothetical protein